MAFFKFRKDGDEHTTPSPAQESVEAMRKRAKHRLIGAVVLVAVGVIGFPLLFDNQPRPISINLPIDIPDKNTVKPLGNLPVGNAAAGGKIIDETAAPETTTAATTATTSQAAKPAASSPPPAASRTAAGTVGNATDVLPEKPPAKSIEKAVEKPAEKPKLELLAKPQPVKPDSAKSDGSRARSLLEGKESFVPSSAASSAPVGVVRYVVQVGAFSDAVKAHEIRIKLESSGLKTYTQVVTPKEGKRTRVRVGPFENKAEADKAAAKVKTLDLPAAILEL